MWIPGDDCTIIGFYDVDVFKHRHLYLLTVVGVRNVTPAGTLVTGLSLCNFPRTGALWVGDYGFGK